MLTCLVLLCSTFLTKTSAEKKLLFTHVIYRHGDRNPSGTFPTDLYQEDFWPQGWSQLTTVGMQQQFELGQYFRQRYKGFLNDSYKRDEIYVRASDQDRTLQSAQCNLAGLYPASGDQTWNSNLSNWHPIPIHTIPELDDILLFMEVECPQYNELFNKETLSSIHEINNQHKDFFHFVKMQTGLDDLDVISIGDIYSSLYREKEKELKLADWVLAVYDKERNLSAFDIIDKLKTYSINVKYNSPEKVKFRAGYLLGDILTRIKAKANNTINKPSKMVMYSTHGDTILALLYIMNVSNEIIAPYGATIMIELFQTDDNGDRYTVETFYRNDTRKDPYPLTVPGCPGFSCPLATFERILGDKTLFPSEKRDKYCGLRQPPACSGATKDKLSAFRTIFVAVILFSRAIIS